jgi:NADH-quinone oxidoreductase subunit N
MNALILVSLVGIAALFGGVFNFKGQTTLWIAIVGLIAAMGLNFMDWGTNTSWFNNMAKFDNFSLAFNWVIMLSTLLVLLLCSHHYRHVAQNMIADVYGLILFTLSGGMIMTSYSNLTMLFLGIEILSISLYILAGSNRADKNSNESAMKYFLMGSFASGFLLFGIALIFGVTGSFHLDSIKSFLEANPAAAGNSMLGVGLLMMLVGFLFKVAAVPFHFWAPDVYQGAPTLITGFMATVVKTAGFAAFFRLFSTCFSNVEGLWVPVLTIAAVMTLFVGNITALYQKGIKRLLAYSSISHAGYLILGILAMKQGAANALFFYTAIYSVATICAFAVLIAVKEITETDDINSLNGLAKTNPLLALAMTIAFLSLAGIPPLAGFFAKYYLFTIAMKAGYGWLVIIALINSLIAAYYYLKVINAMYTSKENSKKIEVNWAYNLVLGIAAVLIIAFGILPGLISDLI